MSAHLVVLDHRAGFQIRRGHPAGCAESLSRTSVGTGRQTLLGCASDALWTVATGKFGEQPLSSTHLIVVEYGQGAAREAQPVGRQLLQPDGRCQADRVAVVLPDLRAGELQFSRHK